jgi:hypothetical protein
LIIKYSHRKIEDYNQVCVQAKKLDRIRDQSSVEDNFRTAIDALHDVVQHRLVETTCE